MLGAGRVRAAGLDILDVKEAAADAFADLPLQLGGAPADLKIVADGDVAAAVVEQMRNGILAEELPHFVEARVAVEAGQEWVAADPR
ncbi:hypothetical protein GCM10022276_16480 [Sphingomonas limnosediminicola]|uniref:Uncharacterized protein n=1 Tax=Sphingomonas limnosediminicola TaxID=940133 RepID=A0ABP7LAR7_9SPHN